MQGLLALSAAPEPISHCHPLHLDGRCAGRFGPMAFQCISQSCPIPMGCPISFSFPFHLFSAAELHSENVEVSQTGLSVDPRAEPVVGMGERRVALTLWSSDPDKCAFTCTHTRVLPAARPPAGLGHLCLYVPRKGTYGQKEHTLLAQASVVFRGGLSPYDTSLRTIVLPTADGIFMRWELTSVWDWGCFHPIGTVRSHSLLHCPHPSNAEQVLRDFLPYVQNVGGCREEPFELRNNCWLLASLCVHQRTAICNVDVPREAPIWQRVMSCVHGGTPSKGNTVSTFCSSCTQQCQTCRAVPMPLSRHCFSQLCAGHGDALQLMGTARC